MISDHVSKLQNIYLLNIKPMNVTCTRVKKFEETKKVFLTNELLSKYM